MLSKQRKDQQKPHTFWSCIQHHVLDLAFKLLTAYSYQLHCSESGPTFSLTVCGDFMISGAIQGRVPRWEETPLT